MRVVRNYGHTRVAHFTRFSSEQSRRPLRNAVQNCPEKKIPSVPPIETESVFAQVGLQVFGAYALVDAADPAWQANNGLNCPGRDGVEKD